MVRMSLGMGPPHPSQGMYPQPMPGGGGVGMPPVGGGMSGDIHVRPGMMIDPSSVNSYQPAQGWE